MRIVCIIFISLFLVAGMWNTGKAQDRIEHSSFQWINLPLRSALDSLMKWYSESIVYLDDDVEGKTVSVVCSNCGFDQALSSVLQRTSLTWIQRGNQIILKLQETQIAERYAVISGVVTDSITGDWIQGASVLLQTPKDHDSEVIKRWCPTNTFGFFSLPRIPIGRYIITVHAIGYVPWTMVIDSMTEESMHLKVSMVPKAIVLGEVTVEGNRFVLASVEQFSRGIYRPSVPSDQNQYMLDGGRIYNPAHFGGVLSTFSPEGLTDVQVLLGGLPPSYGGRIGGIMDLSLREGSHQRFGGSAGIGTLGSQLSFEGPIAERTTFLISGRRGYPDAAWQFLSRTPDALSRTFTSELTSKLTHRLSGSNQIMISGYWGSDSYENNVKDIGENLHNDFSWENAMVDLRWISVISSSLFLHASVVYSNYDFKLHHALNENSILFSTVQRSSDYTIEDWSIDAHAESYYTEDHTLRAGVELIHHAIDGNISEFSTQIAPFSLRQRASWEAAVYLQDQWRIISQLIMELGGRIGSFSSDRGTFSTVDPRFSLLAPLNEQTHLYGSCSVINQYLHPYRNSGIFLFYPTVFWYPSTDTVAPSNSLHITLGVERSTVNDTYLFSAELYYRITNNLHEFNSDTSTNHSIDLEQLSLSGTGKTYGLLCSIRKRLGTLTGSISYSLSWLNESFAEINGGKEFVPPFDRRHEIQVAAIYMLSENWSVSMLCVAASGQTSMFVSNSIPTIEYYDRSKISTNAPPAGFTDVNGGKLPGFQRLELNVTGKFLFYDVPCQCTLRMLNSYGLLDPFQWKLLRSGPGGLSWKAAVQDIRLFPLYPSLELLIRF
jgi:hypothetical protein